MIWKAPLRSIVTAIAGMAPANGQVLRKRFVSAAILLPLALLDVWAGSPYWDALVGLFAVVMAWEWAAMCAVGAKPSRGMVLGVGPAGTLSILAVSLAVAMAAFERYQQSLLLLVIGAALTAIIGAQIQRGRGRWHGLGTLYIGLPSVAIIWVRSEPADGFVTVLWLLALVIAADTGAFAAGRLIGGAKLAPGISPNKTWAGLIGAIAAASLVGWLVAIWLGLTTPLPLVLVSGALAIVEQLGDLAESAFKRYFGVKDSSHLIPGHGGVLDRVDGLLAVSTAVALGELFGGGFLGWTR
jgi:phosphatidate cytidylyltransferase